VRHADAAFLPTPPDAYRGLARKGRREPRRKHSGHPSPLNY
jgi:hypothetical protein